MDDNLTYPLTRTFRSRARSTTTWALVNDSSTLQLILFRLKPSVAERKIPISWTSSANAASNPLKFGINTGNEISPFATDNFMLSITDLASDN